MKLYENQVWLHKRYIIEKKTIVEMAQEAGCSHMTVQRALEKYGMIRNQRKWSR
jgi:transposase-like protein